MEIKIIHEFGPQSLAALVALATALSSGAVNAEVKKEIAEKAAPKAASPKPTGAAAPKGTPTPKAETGDKAVAPAPPKATAPTPTPTPTPSPSPSPAPAPKASAPAPAPKAAPAPAADVPFEELDDNGKREVIKATVAKHTKKGNGKDVRAMLGVYGASNSSELGAEWLDAFKGALDRYAAGETPAQLFPDHLG